jgi:hypothetical protein
MRRIVSLLIPVCLLAGCSSNTVPTSAAAVTALEYLGKQPGVAEHVVEGNGVFVIFEQRKPRDWKAVLEAAALAGEKATGAEFTASGILGASKNWRSYADSNTIGVATARAGKIVK